MLTDLIHRLRSLTRRPVVEQELDEELRFHFERLVERYVAKGVSRDEAVRLARSEMGTFEWIKEEHRDARGVRVVDELWQDVHQAGRGLTKHPGFAAVAILTLALGIGATTAIFSVVNGVLIKPLPYRDPDALVRIVHDIGGIRQPYFSDAIFVTYVENTQAFESLGVWLPGVTSIVTGLGDPEEVRALRASSDLLTTLGVRPQLGRALTTEDETPGSPNVVILAGGYWRRKLGGDRDVLQRTLIIDGRPHEVVGVMPADFAFSGEFDLVLPQRISRAAPGTAFARVGVARLKPGVTLAQANADVARVLDIWFEKSGGSPAVRARWTPALTPLKADVVGDVGTTLWVLMGAIAVVLLMACANIANLLLVRADTRRQELAIRRALGASVGRIARQLLVESLTLALLGGVLGIALSYGGVRTLVALAPTSLPRLSEIAMDPVVLGFALVVSMACGLLFGLVPILKHARPRLTDMFATTRAMSTTRERQRSQHTLVAAQMALALVLLVSAGLMIRSFQALRKVDPGFIQPERIQAVSISIPPSLVAESERVTQMQHEIVDRIAAIPGVVSTAFTTRLPMDSVRASAALLVEGTQVDPGRTPPNRQVKIVSPGAFETFGTPLVAGRDFNWTDLHDSRDAAIVSENLAREFWGTPSAALGKRVREYYDAQGRWWEIVGVAADVHDDGVEQPAPATIYWPAQPQQRLLGIGGYQARRVAVVIRSERAGTESLMSEVRERVASISPTLALAQIRTLDELYRQSTARASFTLVMLAVAGAMALLLGVSGLYGVIAYAVSQRRREIGIRLALGAQPGDIQRLFMRRGFAVSAIGMTIGLGAASAVTPLIRALLFGINPLDPITFAMMPVVLAVTALLASYLPARRAVAINPSETLKAE